MPRFADIEGNVVRYVLPAALANDYPVLVNNQVEIALNSDVAEGDIYEDGVFRKRTIEELSVPALAAFRTERIRLFTETEWVRERHTDRIELSIDDSVNWLAWLNYWQSLRDMPNSEGFDPTTPVWPTQP